MRRARACSQEPLRMVPPRVRAHTHRGRTTPGLPARPNASSRARAGRSRRRCPRRRASCLPKRGSRSGARRPDREAAVGPPASGEARHAGRPRPRNHTSLSTPSLAASPRPHRRGALGSARVRCSLWPHHTQPASPGSAVGVPCGRAARVLRGARRAHSECGRAARPIVRDRRHPGLRHIFLHIRPRVQAPGLRCGTLHNATRFGPQAVAAATSVRQSSSDSTSALNEAAHERMVMHPLRMQGAGQSQVRRAADVAAG